MRWFWRVLHVLTVEVEKSERKYFTLADYYRVESVPRTKHRSNIKLIYRCALKSTTLQRDQTEGVLLMVCLLCLRYELLQNKSIRFSFSQVLLWRVCESLKCVSHLLNHFYPAFYHR